MAPGGFLAYVLRRFPTGLADAITLPQAEGGHQVLLPLGDQHFQISIVFADVTMYAGELGVQSVPQDHQEAQKLLAPWPHPKRSYDLVICDGQALRTQNVPEYRQLSEQSRLFNSQLVIALQKVRVGGTIIALLHKSHKWRTFALLQLFGKFSDIQVFKPERFHAEKSSFYLVAKNVRSQSREAAEAIDSFRRSWMRGTFGSSSTSTGVKNRAVDEPGDGEGDGFGDQREDDVGARMLQGFGEKFVRLMQPVWMAQASALDKASWMKK
jgi:23S rRNA U2552 (ribose-2'-O)-methylase RlmE/FtsJ